MTKHYYNNQNGIAIYDDFAFTKVQESANLAKKVMELAKSLIQEGISTEEINNKCHEFTIKNGGISAPLDYNGFPKSICTSLNNVVCHGIPSPKEILKNGDIVNIDITTIVDGFFADTNKTFLVGNVSQEAQNLVEITKKCLDEAIKIIKPNMHFGDIGYTIQQIAEKQGYSVVREFCGHGIGYAFHLPPNVLHYGEKNSGYKIEEGMIFTIEPMINMGQKEVLILNDDWTVVTKDGSLSAQFEHTIGVTKNGCIVFTK